MSSAVQNGTSNVDNEPADLETQREGDMAAKGVANLPMRGADAITEIEREKKGHNKGRAIPSDSFKRMKLTILSGRYG